MLPCSGFLKIVFGSTILSCILGISLDLITANVAVEYFSVHHPEVIPTKQSVGIGMFWGVAASWWFVAISGVIAGFINHRRDQNLAIPPNSRPRQREGSAKPGEGREI